MVQLGKKQQWGVGPRARRGAPRDAAEELARRKIRSKYRSAPTPSKDGDRSNRQRWRRSRTGRCSRELRAPRACARKSVREFCTAEFARANFSAALGSACDSYFIQHAPRLSSVHPCRIVAKTARTRTPTSARQPSCVACAMAQGFSGSARSCDGARQAGVAACAGFAAALRRRLGEPRRRRLAVSLVACAAHAGPAAAPRHSPSSSRASAAHLQRRARAAVAARARQPSRAAAAPSTPCAAALANHAAAASRS